MMYRQRLFMETAPKLIQGFNAAESGRLLREIQLTMLMIMMTTTTGNDSCVIFSNCLMALYNS